MIDLIERIRSGDEFYGDEIVRALDLRGVDSVHAAVGAAFGSVNDAVRLVQMTGRDPTPFIASAVAELCRVGSGSRQVGDHLAALILVAALEAGVTKGLALSVEH